uniref:Secreted protein n=1 Tax=Salmo trutta TaxID=8032 RepID=A0A674CIV4_SALTR
MLFSLVIFRWLICSLAVRFFHNTLNAELKIKSVGLFSVHGISIQFQPQHTLVGHVHITFTQSVWLMKLNLGMCIFPIHI